MARFLDVCGGPRYLPCKVPVRSSVTGSGSVGRLRGARILPTVAFLIASCGHPPEAGKGLDAAPAVVAAPASPPALAAPPADTAPYRTAFDFVANRVHAVSHRDGRLVVDAGALDFLKYVDGGWKTSWLLGEKDEGKPASLINGVSAMAFLPVDADGDGAGGAAPGASTLSITMRSLAPAQKVSIFVNEKPVGTIDVAGPKKRYDVVVPPDLLHAGDNRVRLTFKSAANLAGGKRSAAAIQQIALGPAALGAAAGRSRDRGSARRDRRRRGPPGAVRGRSRVADLLLRSAPSRRAPGGRLRQRGTAGRWDGAGSRRRRRAAGADAARGSDRRALDRSAARLRRGCRARGAHRFRRARWCGGLGGAAGRGEGACARLAADAAAAVRSHLRLDGRHVPRRQDARLQRQDARADAELRRLRRRCHPLRLGDGAGDLVAAVARVAADGGLPDGAQGDRARVEALAHRPLRRRGAEARRLQDGDVLLERLHLVEVGVRSRLGHRPQLHPRVAPQQRRLPLEDGQELDHAAAHQAAVRLPRHHRAARRLHAEERVPGQVLEQALHRAR